MADILADYGGCISGIVVFVFLILALYPNFFPKGQQLKRKPEHEITRPNEVMHEEINPAITRYLEDKNGVIRTIVGGEIVNYADKKAVYYDSDGLEVKIDNFDSVRPKNSFYAFFGNHDVVWEIQDDDYVEKLKDTNSRIRAYNKTLKEDRNKYITDIKEGMVLMGETDKAHRQAKYGRGGGGGFGAYTPWWRRGIGGPMMEGGQGEGEGEMM